VQAEAALESRVLLAAQVGLDFTVIASDLSETERFFGSSDPAEAPFTALRYGAGTLTSLEGLPDLSAALGGNPSNLTFSFGTNETSNPVRVVSLSSFDDGVADGEANQFYTPGPGDNPTLTVFNAGTPVATGRVEYISLATDPYLQVTSPRSAPLRLVIEKAVGSNTVVADAIFEATGGTGIIDVTLDPFDYAGPWIGVGDAEVFQTSGTVLGLIEDSGSQETQQPGEQRFFGAISTLGDMDTFSFTLAQPTHLWLDSLTSDNLGTIWSLSGPQGEITSNNYLSYGDDDLGLLPIGDYTITVQGATGHTGAYEFRLRDLATASPVNTGTSGVNEGPEVTGRLSVGTETNFYRFNGTAGTELNFQNISLTGSDDAYWELTDAYGAQLFSASLEYTQSNITLPTTGVYTLKVAGIGNVYDTTNYSFQVDWVSFTEPPALPGTGINVGDTVTGNIADYSQEDFYKFTLTSTTTLWFDVLTGSDTGARWTLTGPSGNLTNYRPFSYDDDVLKDLPAGEYSLLITGDDLGNYGFRLLNATAGTPLTIGQPRTGTLNPANSLNTHQFTGTAGSTLYFDTVAFTSTDTSGFSGYATIDLYDSYGSSVATSTLDAGFGRITLPTTGVYTVAVRGYHLTNGQTDYTLLASVITDDHATLTIGSTVNGTMSQLGQHDVYEFTLNSPTSLLFNGLATTSGFCGITLEGDQGIIFANHSMSSPLSYMETLPAGTYRVTVESTETGNYSFRLLDRSTAIPITHGNAVVGNLAPANSMNVYSINGVAGQPIYLATTDFSTTDSSGYNGFTLLEVIDQYGTVISSVDISGGDVGRIEFPRTETYTIVVSGYFALNGTTEYTLQSSAVIDGSAALPLGDTVTDSLSALGVKDRYYFTLNSETRLWFDSLTTSSNTYWTLSGPTGSVIASQYFSNDDLLTSNLAPGNYTLQVESDSVSNYSFRLLDLASAASLTVGTSGTPTGSTETATLTPANSASLYQFDADAGTEFSFESLSQTSETNVFWTLISPYGSQVFYDQFMSGQTLTLEQSGNWTLVVYGLVAETTPAEFSFRVNWESFTAPPVVSGTDIEFGEIVEGTLVDENDEHVYVFDLTSTTSLLFDSQSEDAYSASWTLSGPTGELISSYYFSYDDYKFDSLPAGTYVLTVAGLAAGDYRFQILDLDNATPLTIDNTTSGTLNPSGGATAYTFTGTAGQLLYLDSLNFTTTDDSGNAATSTWRLVDPYGGVVGNGTLATDIGRVQLDYAGLYTLLIQGTVSANGTIDYEIKLSSIADDFAIISPGNTVTGSISHLGQHDTYQVTLASPSSLWLDSLTEDNVNASWILRGPTGTQLANSAFSYGDTHLGLLPAGSYTLQISAETTGDYAFRILDINQAAPIALDSTVSGTLTPSDSTQLFRFDGTAGDYVYLDTLTFSSTDSTDTASQTSMQLYDQFGNQIGVGNFLTDFGRIQLPSTGTYTLALIGPVTADGVSNYSFRVLSIDTQNENELWGIGGSDTFEVAVDSSSSRRVYRNGNLLGTLTNTDPLTVTGMGGSNVFRILGSTSADTATATSTSVSVGSTVADFSGIERLIVHGEGGNDVISVTSVAAGMNVVVDGGADNDTITVSSSVTASTLLFGGSGNDTLNGGDGVDVLHGNEGNDTLNGGRGSDELIGGIGNDTYVFTATTVGGEVDTIAEASSLDSDTLDFSSQTTAVTLQIGVGTQQTVHTGRSLILGSGLAIENAIGGSGNDSLTGNSRSNTLTGNAGNDTLNGGSGSDTLVGGLGNDTYVFTGAAAGGEVDTIAEAASLDSDTLDFSSQTSAVTLQIGVGTQQAVHTGRSLILGSGLAIENAIGGSGNDSLTGSSRTNTLTGNAGNDTLNGSSGSDTLVGGLGNDTYVFTGAASGGEVDTIVEAASLDSDTLDFSSQSSAVTVQIGVGTQQTVHTGRSLILGSGLAIENAIGGSGNDSLTGNSRSNTLTGNAGNDTLNGGSGSDTLVGGLGNDTYVFTSAASGGEVDTIVEAASLDSDTLDFSSRSTTVTIHLGLATQQTVHTGRAVILGSDLAIENVTSGSGNDSLTGNSRSNTLTGNTGNDTLNGGLGSDTLVGGAGNDIYVFGGTASGGEVDTIVEASSLDSDTLDFSSQSSAVTVQIGVGTQQTVHTGRSLILGSGLAIENAIGGSGNDSLTGNSRANTLTGNAGNDTLNGGSGSDTLVGGLGNDTYVFTSAASGGEVDTIVEAASLDSDTLDFSSRSTTVTIHLGLATQQTVHTGRAVILGSDLAIETVTSGSGNDSLTGNSRSNTLTGNTGNDTLNGGLGSDTLVGGAGNDIYVFGGTASGGEVDTVVEAASLDSDTLDFSSQSSAVTLQIGVGTQQTVHTGRSLILGSGLAIENAIGGSGNDSLTGNSRSNTLTGNAGIDTLNGSSGSDTLVGGAGSDIYVFGGTSSGGEVDTIVEASSLDSDTLDFSSRTTAVTLHIGVGTQQVVHTGRSLILGSGLAIENAIGGSGNDSLTGNSRSNTLTGNAGNDTLNGGLGNDTLIGGAGNDIYVFGGTASGGEVDTIVEAASLDSDTLDFSSQTSAVTLQIGVGAQQTVHTGRSLILGSGLAIENAIGGSGNDSLTGNSRANTLTGNAGNDTLNGGLGSDALIGGLGDDVYVFGGATVGGELDTITEAAGQGTDTLDFSSRSTAVTVNISDSKNQQQVHTDRQIKLSSGLGFEIVLGGSGNDTITGNSSINVLVGNGGNDTLIGNSGRDILIGGLGLDTLSGGNDDDILISGRTTHDANSVALGALLTGWTSTSSYSTRVANLKAGVGSPSVELIAKSTALNDAGEKDSLNGGAGTDWFFKALDEVITSLVSGELIETL
jgi:Ca2+-binding RTX toxin-like protein